MFYLTLTLTLGDPLKKENSQRMIDSLKQGNRTAQDYVNSFEELAQKTAFDETALKFFFIKGLKAEIQAEFARTATPETLEECILFAVQMDLRLNNFFQTNPRFKPQAPRLDSPMEIGAIMRTDFAERDRRRKLGLCQYCGEKGHFKADCPKRAANETRKAIGTKRND